ncbi:class I SAM-dependent methyltransferase [Acinetobacter indicus]|uniref:class I SAM-dependent methyltransferase n=1 Tax=Acinetobacter indicus TaxID=756892 RepID=UPI000CEC4B1A|nr:class I SAM-dependent methyltransferase [Acinetobacter indicus]
MTPRFSNPWDERYHSTDHLYGEAANVFIQQMAPQLAISGATLGIAEGEGRNLIYLAERAREQQLPFAGLLWDYSTVALEKAQKHAQAKQLTLDTAAVDLSQVEWPENQFQHAICVFGHVNQPTQQKLLHGVRHSLKSGGWFIGEVYSKAQLAYATGGPGNPDMLYDPRDFLEIFQQDHLLHFFVGEVERHEGQLHQGKSHVIQFAIQIRK